MTTRRPPDSGGVLIVGGGASGLAAACVCLETGLRVTLLEKEARVGRKLLATGNGRCNLLNTGPLRYFGQAAFAEELLRACPAGEVLAFFHGLGLTTHEEEGGRVYPASGQAASVLDALRYPLEEGAGARVLTGEAARDILPGPDGFTVTADGGPFFARAVILAGGGKAAPRLGGGGLYPMLSKLGHRVTPLRPALAPLETERGPVRGLCGLRLPAVLTLTDGRGPVAASGGELLFTDYGVSGVCVMDLSRIAGELLAAGRRPVLSLDFSPLLGLASRDAGLLAPQEPGLRREAALDFLKARADQLPARRLLIGAVPRLLAERFQALPLPQMAERLTDYRLQVLSVRGFEHAQTTAGGIVTDDVDPRTLQSRRVPGLFLAGELLDVDGPCGGYNLLFAWASGVLAARGAAAFLS